MKKSVRIRKAGPGEKPGYYNKTAKFLYGGLVKANMGMQVNNNPQEIMQSIMSDVYASLRDGTDPNMVFQDLVVNKKLEQEVAFQIMDVVMKKLAENNLANPDYLDDEDDAENTGGQQSPEQSTAPTGNPVGTPGEEEDLAMSMVDDDTDEGAMNHLNEPSAVEQDEQQQAFAYGGYFDEGGEAEDYYNMYQNGMSQNNQTPEDTVVDQYANPGQLSDEQNVPFSLERLMQFTPGVQNYEPTPDLATYLNAYPYHNVADEDIPNDLLPMSQAKFGGYLPKAKVGRVVKTSTTPTPTAPKPKRGRPKKGTTSAPLNPTVTVEPQVVSGMTPDMLQRFQNYFNSRNPLSERSGVGKFTEGVGTVLNTIRPQNWTENWRSKVEPSTTATQTLADIINKIRNPEYETQVIQPNVDGTYNSGLAFNMGPDLSTTLLEISKEKDVMAGLKKGSPVTLEIPTSTVPELNFLSLHNDKNKTQIRLTMDTAGKIKADLITDVKTKIKGFDKNGVVIKDEFLIDPKAKQIIDFKTGMPLEMIQKSYYSGNQLNFWNSANKTADQLAGYPKVISTEALNTKPATGWNKFYNLGIKPLALGPLAAFGYPGFKQKSQFSPNASKITADFLGRQREVGPQSPGGMTFGDQPIGTQFADFNLQRDRNYKTGRNFMLGTGLLGAGAGLGYLYYNRDTKDFLQDNSEGAPLQNINVNDPTKKPGFGFSFNPNWGRNRSEYDVENNYGLDSMNINNGDTIDDKGWGAPTEDYKTGGAHKKKFLKKMTSKYAPGGEAQDTSLGKGNRMDNGNVPKANNFFRKLSTSANDAASSELYELVKKSGDPKLMNIFIGEQEDPSQDMMPQEEMEEGGYVNMDDDNPLTRFVYGGDDENPDYYEPYDIPEARNGGMMKGPKMKYQDWFVDQTNPDNWPGAYANNEPGDDVLGTDPNETAAYENWLDAYTGQSADQEAQRFEDYQNYLKFYSSVGEDDETNPQIVSPNTGVVTSKGTNCGPGTVWSATYNQCIPVGTVRYNPRMVRRAPGLLNTLGLWGNARSPYERILQANYLGSNMPYMGDLNSLGKPVATFKKNWLAPKLRIYDPNGNYGKEELDQIISSYYGGKGAPKSMLDKLSKLPKQKNEKSKKEKVEKEKSGPKEVKFSTPALKYRINQVAKPHIDFYKNLGKKVIKTVTKKK